MAEVIINLVFNDTEDSPYRETILFEQKGYTLGLVITPQKNRVIMRDTGRDLVKIKEEEGGFKVLNFVESIYADGLKIFDYNDFDVKTYTEDGEKKYRLEDRRAIKIPVIL